MKVLFSFPGQGAQFVNMLHQLPTCEITRSILDCACDTLDEDVLLLDSVEALQTTRAVQLCILITGVVYANILQHKGVHADYSCGLSIGAFSAAVFAGALDFKDALRLVSLRGELMQRAYPHGYGLTSIQGLLQAQVKSIVKQVNSQQFPVFIANYNDEDQFVIAGSEQAMLKVATIAKQSGARKVTKLAVSVPSHCELMANAAQQLAKAMQSIKFKLPQISYISSNTARLLTQPDKIAEDLAYNMAHSVYWHETMVSAYERGVKLAIEIPPGAVLTGLTKKVMEQSEVVGLSQLGIEQTIQLFNILTKN